MKCPYLVANPAGCFLVRCETMDQVKEFVTNHADRCKNAYKLLLGRELSPSMYSIRDLREIPTIDEIKA